MVDHSAGVPRTLVNLRDTASAAPQRLRRGVLLRSEAPRPDDREPADVAWPPATVIDLRSPGELGPGPHPLAGPGISVVGLPLIASLAPTAIDLGTPLPRIYLAVLDLASAWFPALVGHAARAPGPLLVHCAAGKDRTGLAVALLLALADVAREDIVRDYAATAAAMDGVYARLDLADGAVPRARLAVRPEAMEAVLDRVDDAGGPAAFARAVGVDDGDVTVWRRRVLLA